MLMKKNVGTIKIILGSIFIGLLVGVILGFRLYGVVFSDDSNSKVNSEQNKVEKPSKTTKEINNNTLGNISNPVPLGQGFTVENLKNFISDTSFNVKFEVEKFVDSSTLPDFTPILDVSDSIKQDYIYYAIKLKITILKSTDADSSYYMDALNDGKLFVDNVQADDYLYSMRLNNYPGVDGEMFEGTSKEGWIGVQAPNNANSLVLKLGDPTNFAYFKLK